MKPLIPLVLALPCLLSASDVTLVKDIDPPDADVGGRLLTRAGNQLFFLSGEGDLWVSDGTAGGTRLVKEFGPFDIDPDETAFVAVGANIFFTADTDTAGVELWRSDGTPGGTFMVKDIAPGTDSAFSLGFGFQPFDALPLGNAVYFIADDGEHGPELWKSDGTAAGTKMACDLFPGTESAFLNGFSVNEPVQMAEMGGTLYFFGKDPAAGDELRRLGSPSLARLPDMGITRGTGGNLLMTFTAPEAGSYRLERSTSLSSWEPVETRTATAQQVMNFTAPASGTAFRYFRISKL